MKPFAMAERALLDICDMAAAVGDEKGHAVALELLAGLRALGGWQAFHPDIHRSSRGGAAARQARYRARKRDAADVTGSVTSGVTQTITSDATDRNAELVSASPLLSLVGEKHKNSTENKEESAREGVTKNVTRDVTHKASRGTRCTIDYTPRNETIEALKSQGHKDPLSLLQDFRLYWVPLTGPNATKLDWDLTFMRWVQRERPKTPTGRSYGRIVQSSQADFSDFDNAGTPR